MLLNDFDYELPADLIARYPLPERSSSRLLCLSSGEIAHRQFTDVVSLLTPKDLLVFNNTRVIPARIYGKKQSGGQVEVLVERILDEHRILAQVRASKSPKSGSLLILGDQTQFEVLGRHEDLYELRCTSSENVLQKIERIGQIPLPPYFYREPEESDKERYQTIFAEHKGSVAAPTAGLHFDELIFKKIQEANIETAYLTLHVGAGTFASVRVENIKDHRMHAEYIDVPETICEKIKNTKARGGRVIAVGTTTARSLETAARSGTINPFRGDTQIFIYPGFKFNCVDALITNFHLPCSTLLMLVSALGGKENVFKAYAQAVQQKYRFFSYGDAMWVTP